MKVKLAKGMSVLVILSLVSCTSPSLNNLTGKPDDTNIVMLQKSGVLTADGQTAYIADVGKGKKGANFSINIKFPVSGADFKTKSANTSGVPAKTAADVNTYQVYLIKNTSTTGYPGIGDPIGDKIAGPFTITNSGAATKTVTFANVPSTGSPGVAAYYAAVRALDSGSNDLIKVNNGSGTAWTGTTAASPFNSHIAVSSGAGIQVTSAFAVSSTTALSVIPNLQDAVGAIIQTDIGPNSGSSLLAPVTANGTAGASIPANVILVNNALSTGANNGTSWADAFRGTTALQSALTAATTGKEIWIATGTYKPGVTASDTFALKSNVNIYGGFAGTENQLSLRNPNTNVVTLSGDLNGDDTDGNLTANKTDNSATVVTSVNRTNLILDGVSIKYAVGSGLSNTNSSTTLSNITFSNNKGFEGGGMNNNSTSLTLTNSTFSNNTASFGGGGMYNVNSSPTITNVTFSNNTAPSGGGGGMYNVTASPNLINVTFSNNSCGGGGGGGILNGSSSSPNISNSRFLNNTSADHGGGIYNYVSSAAIITNTIFANNSGSNFGGGISNYSSTPTITNCSFSNNTSATGKSLFGFGATLTVTNSIFWGSSTNMIALQGSSILKIGYSDLQTGFANIVGTTVQNLSGTVLTSGTFTTGGNNITGDPLFTDTASAAAIAGTDGGIGLKLQPGSPAIDAGTDSGIPAAQRDITGILRINTFDIGAYEFVQ